MMLSKPEISTTTDDAGALLPQYMRDRQPLTDEQLDRLRSDVARPRYDSDDWLAGPHTRSMVRRLLATLDAARQPVVGGRSDYDASGLRRALTLIEDPGCESSRFYGEDPPVWDRCLDYEYREDHPTGNPDKDRCNPCLAHAALAPDDGSGSQDGLLREAAAHVVSVFRTIPASLAAVHVSAIDMLDGFVQRATTQGQPPVTGDSTVVPDDKDEQ